MTVLTSDDDALDPVFTGDLLHAVMASIPVTDLDGDERRQRRQAATVSALRALDAQEPIEAMLAAHAVLAHHAAMTCYQRAARFSHHSPLSLRMLGDAAALSRTFCSLLETLGRRRARSGGT